MAWYHLEQSMTYDSDMGENYLWLMIQIWASTIYDLWLRYGPVQTMTYDLISPRTIYDLWLRYGAVQTMTYDLISPRTIYDL